MTIKNEGLMQQSGPTTPMRRDDRRAMGVISAFLLSLSILGVAGLILQDDLSQLFLYAYLIPWILVVLVVVCIPVVYLIVRGSFSLFHPLVYAAWSYFLPAFVLGSLFLATGHYDPWYMGMISNPEYYLPLTLIYIALGFAGLTLGFAFPFGRRIGGAIARKLPSWDWEVSDLFRPAVLLIIIGELAKLGAYATGNFGFQISEETSTFGATLSMFGLLSEMGSFILWITIFRAKRLGFRHYLTALFLIALMVFSMILSGNKGGLLSSVVLIIGAFACSGRRIKLRQTLLIGLLVVGAVLVGMAYGTVFRQIKGNEAQISLQDYFGLGSVTAIQLVNQSLGENLSVSTDALAQRLETAGQLAVFVSSYKYLQPLEASYGVADIWTMTWTAFIPRAIWPGKPNISGARALGLLYFGYGDSSPAVSPMIDLLRNFGPIGILPGMALLGIILSTIYSALIQGQTLSAWRAAGYFLFLTNVSYEGLYGTILPVLIRVCVVFSIGLALLYIVKPHYDRPHSTRIY